MTQKKFIQKIKIAIEHSTQAEKYSWGKNYDKNKRQSHLDKMDEIMCELNITNLEAYASMVVLNN